METGGDSYLRIEKKNEIISSIQNSDKLPDNFLEAYNKTYPRSLSGNYWGFALERIISKKSDRQCPCRQVALFIPKQNINSSLGFVKFVPTMIGLELEDYVSQEECLSYLSSQYEFPRGAQGIRNASLTLFEKDLEEMNNIELTGLLDIMKNSIKYDKLGKLDGYEIIKKAE